MPDEKIITTPSLTDKTLSGFSWTYISMVLQASLQLGTVAVLARILGPREFGVLGLALIFTNFIERVGFFGLGPALVQKKEISDNEIRGGFFISIILGVLSFVLLYLLSPWISGLVSEPALDEVLRFLSILCLVESGSQILEHLLQRELRFKSMLMFNNVAYALGNGVLAITFAMNGFGIWSLVYGTVATRVLRLSFFYYLHPVIPKIVSPFGELSNLIRMGLGFSTGRFFSFLALFGDNLVIGKMLGSVALGMYGRSYQLMTLPSTYFGQILEKVLFPAFSKRQDDLLQIRKVYLWTVQLSSLIGISVSVFMFHTSRELILFLFGDKWVEAIPVLRILSIGVFFRLAYKCSDTLTRSKGAVYQHALRQFVYTCIVLGGAIWGSRYGLTGVAYAVLSAVMINYILLSQLSLKVLDLSWVKFFRAQAAAALIGVGIHLGFLALLPFLRESLISPLLILVITGIFSKLIFIVVLKCCPVWAKPDVFVWISDRFKFRRFGVPGKVLHWLVSA